MIHKAESFLLITTGLLVTKDPFNIVTLSFDSLLDEY